MQATQEEMNKEAILAFLTNNDISPDDVMNFSNRFETAYYVGENRKFYEETTVGFNAQDNNAVNLLLVDINGIEFETAFKITEQIFTYDDESETLTVLAQNPEKHNEPCKIVINSRYLDF
jgi:hypothetical protein